jgi:Icc protein
MRILQITDIHINKLFELTNNIKVIDNFLAILEDGMSYQPDLIVLSGDLGHNDVQEDVYQWVKQQLSDRGVPFRVIGGNHDDASLLCEVFGDVQGKLPHFSYTHEGLKLLFLNTILARVDQEQMSWLRKEINEEVVAIFMHHPPFLAGIPHMDGRYAMEDRPEFLSIFAGINQRIRIFTGHYHTERTIESGNLSVYITPSTFVQISDKTVEFTPDHYKPAYRMITFEGDVFKTWVRYIGME